MEVDFLPTCLENMKHLLKKKYLILSFKKKKKNRIGWIIIITFTKMVLMILIEYRRNRASENHKKHVWPFCIEECRQNEIENRLID